METVSRREGASRAERRGEVQSSSARTVEHTLVLYPGTARRMLLRVYGPGGHVVAVGEHGFPYAVASIEISPREARAPYSSEITVAAHQDATPGVYAWRLRLVDKSASKVLGEEPVTLIILPRGVPLEASRHVAKLKKVYEKYGVQIALWAALKTLYPNGASFSTVKALYELLTGRRVSKGTVGNTLRVMVQKGLLEKSSGLYRALDLDLKVLLSRVNLKRVRYPWQVLKPKPAQNQNRGGNILERYRFSLAELPHPIRRAYMHAKRIAWEYGPLAALYFLLYSLLGVRQTGHLLLWTSGWFIVLEPKTGFAHHFYSWLLHWMLQNLGLQEGVYYKPNNMEHLEAQRIAQKFIREIYGSHQVARRLHYMLWERNLTWSDEEVYTVKVYHYLQDNDVGIQIQDRTGREELYSENLRDWPARTEVYTALPIRHIDKRNEETYFHRPAGIY